MTSILVDSAKTRQRDCLYGRLLNDLHIIDSEEPFKRRKHTERVAKVVEILELGRVE